MIRFHKIWLLLCAIAGIPVAGLSALLVVAAIGVAVQKQTVALNDVVAISLLIAALGLFVWCIVLGLSLRGLTSIPERIRPRLLAFYVLSGIAAAVAATSTWSRQGTGGMIFTPIQAIVLVTFFIVPILALWIERNKKPNHTPDSIRQPADGSSKPSV